MVIHRNYVNKKTQSSLFIVTNFELWVYIEIMWIKRHIVSFLYIATNLKYGYTREYFLCIPIFDNL